MDFGYHFCYKAELKNKEKGTEERRGDIHIERIPGSSEVVSLDTAAPTAGRNNLC